MEIQFSEFEAVHVQLSPVLTMNVSDPPEAGTVAEFELKENVHPEAWLMIKGRPLTLIEALLAEPVFWDTLYDTVPFPTPVDPEVIVSQFVLLLAVH